MQVRERGITAARAPCQNLRGFAHPAGIGDTSYTAVQLRCKVTCPALSCTRASRRKIGTTDSVGRGGCWGWRMLNGLGRPAWFPDNASDKRAIPLPRVHIRVTHRSTRHIGLHPCDLLSLDVRVAEHYLDCSGFGHARVGVGPAVRFSPNENGVSRLGCWAEFGPRNNKLGSPLLTR
jgi:hypothetical protein